MFEGLYLCSMIIKGDKTPFDTSLELVDMWGDNINMLITQKIIEQAWKLCWENNLPKQDSSSICEENLIGEGTRIQQN